MQSPALTSDISGLTLNHATLNHMPHTPSTPMFEPGGGGGEGGGARGDGGGVGDTEMAASVSEMYLSHLSGRNSQNSDFF